MNRKTYFLSVIVAVMALLVVGCAKKAAVVKDSFIRGVVVSKVENAGGKLDSTGGVIRVIHLPDGINGDTILATINLTADALKQRPLTIIWPLLEIGSNVALKYLAEHPPDNIFSLTTADIVLLDRPGDFEQMAALAKQMQKQKLLADDLEVKSLRAIYKQVTAPKE